MSNHFYARFRIVLFLHVLLIYGCNSEDPVEEKILPIESGTYEMSFETEMGLRWYTLIIPSGFNPNEDIPIVFALHPGTGNMTEFTVAMQGLIQAAEENTWMMIFPNGVNNTDNRSGDCLWNAIHCCGLPYRNNVDDVGFIQSLLEFLIEEYKIDEKRIYATGRSNGGMLVHRLGAELGHIFAAIAPFASPAGGIFEEGYEFSIIDPIHPVPILMMHGLNDISTNFSGGISNNMIRWDISFEETVNIWLNTNGCSMENIDSTVHNSDLGKSWILEYKDCSNDANVIAIAVENSGHQIPRISNSGFDGQNAIAQFFKAHKKK